VSLPIELALVLHAHLPYVRHPERDRVLEEDWLHEAIADAYLPLLEVLRAAQARRSRFRLTLSLSPTLLAMLAEPGLPGRFLDYLERRLCLCEAELGRRRHPDRRLVAWYRRRFRKQGRYFTEELDADLIGAWCRLRESGQVELITTLATHGYPPLLRTQAGTVRGQLRVGRDAFRALTGQEPAGLWLPECGYYPGLETEIAAAGYGYSLVEAQGLLLGQPRPEWGVLAPVSLGGVAFFGRDPESAQEVWGGVAGYPAHPDYREYYADLGFEGPSAALADFLPAGVGAGPTGIKYYRVTGGAGPKALYDPGRAARRSRRHALRFLAGRRRAGASGRRDARRPPLILAPYDAELFGHWWYEGPLFLAALSRALGGQQALETVTLGEHLARYGTAGTCQLGASSWGEGGYNATWVRPETAWVQLQLQQAAEEFQVLCRRHGAAPATSRPGRLLRQAGRCLLLAQGSDWTFHLGRGGASDYAAARLRAYLARFAFLAGALAHEPIPAAAADAQSHLSSVLGVGPLEVEEMEVLAALERLDNLFPELDPVHFV